MWKLQHRNYSKARDFPKIAYKAHSRECVSLNCDSAITDLIDFLCASFGVLNLFLISFISLFQLPSIYLMKIKILISNKNRACFALLVPITVWTIVFVHTQFFKRVEALQFLIFSCCHRRNSFMILKIDYQEWFREEMAFRVFIFVMKKIGTQILPWTF